MDKIEMDQNKENINRVMKEAGIDNFAIESMGIDKEMSKFAELIVQECITCALGEIIRNGPQTEHNMAIKKVVESIKEHFE